MNKKITFPSTAIVPALLIAISISLAGFFVGKTLYNAKIGINTAESKGLSERIVTADQANWTLSYAVTGKSRSEIPALYAQAEEHQGLILDILKSGGLTEDEIDIGVLNYSYQEYRNENNELVDQTHTLSGNITVRTNKVKQIPALRANANKLIAQGINLTNQAPQYLFTKLNDVKPDMLKEAARNARIAAAEFAENAGAKVGRIRTARQGAFLIVDVGEDYGDTKRLEKTVRVVTTVEFYLED